MTGRLNPVLAMAAAALLAAPFVSPSSSAAAQAEDYTVLIVDFFAADGQDRGFGERAANELRRAVANVPGFMPVDRGDIEDELDKYGLNMREMDCTKVQQLGSAQLMNTRIAFCVQYTSEGDNRRIADIQVWDLRDRQSFTIPGFTVARNQQREAAQQIFTGFDSFIKQLQFATYCADYANSQAWEDALRNCDQALAINPDGVVILYMKANILREMQRHEEALGVAERVVQLDPVHEDALKLAGYLATQLDQNEKGRQFYRNYLELNPGDAGIRQTIAYDIFQAGDPEGAMLFIEEGLGASDDVSLLLTHGSYAFAAADKASREAQAEAGTATSGPLPPRVVDLYRKALSSFERAFQQLGNEMEVGYLQNIVTAYVQLEEHDQAIRMAEQFMSAYPDNADLVSRYALALERAGRVDDALAALRRVEAMDPNQPNLHLRMAVLLLNANRVDEAIPLLKDAVANGADADQMASLLLGDATSKGFQPGQENWPYAIRILEAAKEFPVSTMLAQQMDFYHGYAIFQHAVSFQPPQGSNQPPSLQVARQTLPMFEQARRIIVNARGWAEQAGTLQNVNAIASAADRYIEIMQTVIRQAGGN